MEVFSLLKLKKARGDAVTQCASARTTTISTSALYLSSDAINDGSHGSGCFDDGPFFDLEFSAGEESTPSEYKMSISSPRHRLSSSSSPFLSEEILFNGRLFRLESSSFSASEPNAIPQLPASTLKSATNLRVFMFRSRSTSRALPPEQKLPKGVILRCISKIKPFYVKVSNLTFSGPSKNRFVAKQSHVQAAVPGRLRKSRSASSAVTSVVSPLVVAPRRDDSLLQQEDGIQSAIAHCKRSFHADKGFGGADLPMVRSMSDPGGERCAGQDRVGGSTADDFSVC